MTRGEIPRTKSTINRKPGELEELGGVTSDARERGLENNRSILSKRAYIRNTSDRLGGKCVIQDKDTQKG